MEEGFAISGFTRQEVMILAKVSSSKLSYIDSTCVITPQKTGNPKHPKVIYSWQKLLGVKVFEKFKKELCWQEIRQLIEFIKSDTSISSKIKSPLVFINKQLYVINNWEDFGLKVLHTCSKEDGSVVIKQIGSFEELIIELRIEGEFVLDFYKRIKGTPLDW